jgi:hypothetical protein
MLCTIWFDLPIALSNLSNTLLSKNEQDSIQLLSSLCKTIQSEYSKLTLQFSSLSLDQNSPSFLIFNTQMIQFNKERIDLQCKCIKQSIQLISKLMTYIETSIQDQKDNDNIMKDVLIKIKYLLKITRIINDKSKEEIRKTKIKKEKKFFTMLLSFTEKIQKKLYEISNNFIHKEINNPKENKSITNNPNTNLTPEQIKL